MAARAAKTAAGAAGAAAQAARGSVPVAGAHGAKGFAAHAQVVKPSTARRRAVERGAGGVRQRAAQARVAVRDDRLGHGRGRFVRFDRLGRRGGVRAVRARAWG